MKPINIAVFPSIPEGMLDLNARAQLLAMGFVLAPYSDNLHDRLRIYASHPRYEDESELKTLLPILQDVIRRNPEDIPFFLVEGSYLWNGESGDRSGGFAYFITAKGHHELNTRKWLSEKALLYLKHRRGPVTPSGVNMPAETRAYFQLVYDYLGGAISHEQCMERLDSFNATK
jgi:hypothetical protein